jgi:phosphohistidine phosphatase
VLEDSLIHFSLSEQYLVMGVSMLLVLMRHGKAEPKKSSLSDFDRRLTDVGKEDVALVARLLPVKPEIIFTSPLKRAVETAEIASRELGGVEVKVAWELEPERASLSSLRELNVLNYSSVLLVGHAPSLEELASTIIGGGRIKMPSASVAGIELSDVDLGRGVLKFLITPEIARKTLK